MAFDVITRTLFRYLLLGLFAVSLVTVGMNIPNMPAAGGQAPMNAKDDPFSPENIAQVAEEISKLTPEQQDQLYKESLEFLSKELNLSPEEVEKMITEEFTQGAGAPAAGTPPAQPTGPAAETLKAEITPTKKPAEEKIVPIKDLNDIAALLKNLADITDTIMRKTSVLPDLPSRVDRWVEQKKLTAWSSGLTWASFKKQLELFVQKLGKLQAREAKTNTYLYLPELLNNVSLKNNLDRIYRTLKRYNETFTTGTLDIDIAFDDPLAGAGSLTAEAKDALLGILNTYGDAFYTHNILKDFDALIQKFEPSAQKLRAAEEERTKKALEESKKTRTAGYIKQAGSKADSFGGGSYYGEPSYDGGGYYPGSSYSPSGYAGGSYPSYGYGTESTKPSDTKEKDSEASRGEGKKNAGEKAAAEDKEVKKEKDDKSSEKKIAIANNISERIAELIRDFGGEIESLTSSLQKDKIITNDSVKKLQDLSKKIERELATLTKTTKDLTPKARGEFFISIQEEYAAHKQKIQEFNQMLAGITPKTVQQPDSAVELEAQKNLKSIESLYDSLNRGLPLDETSLNTLAAITKTPLSDIVTNEEALSLVKDKQVHITDFIKQQETAIREHNEHRKSYEEFLAATDNIKSVSESLKTLDDLMKGLPSSRPKGA